MFLPSFSYEEQLAAHWKASGVWGRLGLLKKLFREPREASELDAVLKAYSQTMEANFEPAGAAAGAGPGRPRGALLLSVVGGKMSEGINFADGLGRCVLMAGLPFANPSDLTLQEKMAHLDGTQGKGAGREYYTNSCMKAVNQSVGRAIRHIADYATIVFADARYAKASVRSRLPKWIGDQLRTPLSYAQALPLIRDFFEARAPGQTAIEQGRRERAEQQQQQKEPAAAALADLT